MQLPIRGKTYPLHFVENSLRLDDAPHLCFPVEFICPEHRTDWVPIQTSHLTKDQLLSVPGFRDTWWKYVRTTHEWIPIFHWSEVNTRALTDFVEVHDVRDRDLRQMFWSTPLGFPRDFQYFDKGELISVRL